MSLKRGPHGCLVADEQGAAADAGVRGHGVDTTGCGDAFCAGVIVARCAGWSIDRAAALGNAAGALTARGLGSDAGARDLAEALEFLEQAPIRDANDAAVAGPRG